MTNKLLIVKIGGSVICKDQLDNVIQDIVKLRIEDKYKIVVIHGGACFVNNVLKSMGKEPIILRHPKGYTSRYVDYETLKIYIMSMMYINKLIVSKLLSRGVESIGISGVDDKLLLAKRKEKILIIDDRGRERIIDGGYTGKIVRVNEELLTKLIDKYVVVLSPIAISDRYELLDVDSDQVVEHVAYTLKPNYVIFLTDVDGVYINGKLIEVITCNDADILHSKDVYGGMKRKLDIALKLAKNGIIVSICSGLKENPIINAFAGKCTKIIC